MSQNVTAAASLGAPRRHRDVSSQPDPSSVGVGAGVGTSISARFGETEWEARESQRQRELEEARARAAQMEKTMKWWSDCTANWREKWSKVRSERNKARDEAKQLRSNLETAIKESNSYKREKNDLELQITQLKKEMEKIHMLLMKHAGQFDKSNLDGIDEPERDNRENNCSPDISSDGLKNVNSEDGLVIKTMTDRGETRDLDIEEYILQGAVPKHPIELYKDKDDHNDEERMLIQQLSKDDYDEEYLLEKISTLQLRLDDAQKTIQLEKEEKNILHKNIDKTSNDLKEIKDKCEELRSAKQEAVRELLTLQEQHRAELRLSNNALKDEMASKEALEDKICDLRKQLEHLRGENATEWEKRERLESEKLALERDNKKLRAEILDLQERSERRGRPIVNSDIEIRNLQQELAEKNKEISDIRHSHSKLKKLLAEANSELGHAVRRAEQYETEVKRLRARVEELKRELAGAEDELDAVCNQVRRLQRTNDELNGQSVVQNAQMVQLQLRNSAPQRASGFFSASSVPKQSIDIKPTINDLKQIFDEPKRSNSVCYDIRHHNTDNIIKQPSKHQMQQIYYDAKQSFIDTENPFDGKPIISSNNRNMFDFERAKQKFDNNLQAQRSKSTHSGSKTGHARSNSGIPMKSRSGISTNVCGSSGNIGVNTVSMYAVMDNNTNIHHVGGNINSIINTTQTHLINDIMSISKQNFNETIQFFDENVKCIKQKDLSIQKTANNINLDDLKVSEDEDTP